MNEAPVTEEQTVLLKVAMSTKAKDIRKEQIAVRKPIAASAHELREKNKAAKAACTAKYHEDMALLNEELERIRSTRKRELTAVTSAVREGHEKSLKAAGVQHLSRVIADFDADNLRT